MAGNSINFVELTPSKNAVGIVSTLYSEVDLKKLRSLNDGNSYFRMGSQVYAWPVSSSGKIITDVFSPILVSTSEQSLIFTKIIENSLWHFFKNADYSIRRDNYSGIYSVNLKAESNIEFEGLILEPILDYYIVNFWSTISKQLVFGLVPDIRYKPVLRINDELLKKYNLDTRDWKKNYQGEYIANSSNTSNLLEATGQKDFYLQEKQKLLNENNLYQLISKYSTSFQKIVPKLYFPDGLTFSVSIYQSLPNKHFRPEIIQKPAYFYHNNKSISGVYYQDALRSLKPFSFDSFTGKEIKISVITPEAFEGTAGTLSQQLHSKLKDYFHLDNISFEFYLCQETLEGYRDVVNKIDYQNTDLVIIIVSDSQKKLLVHESPYFFTKAKLLNQRIPSQDVTVEKIKQNNPFIQNDIALNLYSKIGGTAWTIEKDEKNKTELIVGIGSTLNSQKDRVVGFANVFDYNGSYLVGECSQICTPENYSKSLEQHLISSIKTAIQKKAITKDQPIRLIFHLYKEAGRLGEVQAASNAISVFKDYQIQYAFVHLSFFHPYRIFNDYGRKDVYRGTYLQISSSIALLHFGKGSGRPIQIRLDRRSTYKDLFALSKQVLFFSHLSHRGFRPSKIPVTIKYPKLMSKLTGELRLIPNWDPDQISLVNEKLWFI